MEESVAGEAGVVDELLAFLGVGNRPDVRREAVQGLLGLTGGAEGRRLLAGRPEVAASLLALAGDPYAALALDASRALVNLASELSAHKALLLGLPVLLHRALLEPPAAASGVEEEEEDDDLLAALACATLANLSRDEASCRELWRVLQQEASSGLAPLVEEALHVRGAGGTRAPLQGYLGPLLANLSQLPEARVDLLDRSRCVVQRLLPSTQHMGSSLWRGGVVGTLRNCCFDYGHHEWLLSDDVDVLPFLLLPLAGPEELPEDEMEKLPLDLQYLPPEKQREPDPEIRKMLLQAILLLTATKPGRQLVRERGTYFILRELHKQEADSGVLTACEKLIQVLIGEEPEAGMENLLEVEIPVKVEEQLQRLDREEEQREQPAPGSPATQA
ncbi:protein HGH1 homolog [Heteronotia binoei]|uniref:protein HGH1 homolog n=1 Tax=Heteronotia binoei TaxID=13085 RepID=UPI002931280C|nr:protein HGH1 homolog [Heteronotia binoei]